MTQVYSNDVSAVTPEIWSALIEQPLYKTLVGTESLANTRFESDLKFGDTVHIQRFGSLSAKTYTPGTTISATAMDWLTDNLVVSTYKQVSIYRDDVHQLQANVDLVRELASEMAYQLADKIDQHIFANITGTDGFTVADDQDILGGTNARPLSAGSANIFQIFTGAKKVLRNLNVEERGDWCAILSPGVARHLENKLATTGYNLADITLRNGYMGNVDGFEVYVSKNLPSGSVSVIAPQVSGAANSATTAKAHYFGRKKMVDFVMQKTPSVEIRRKDDMLGSNYIAWTVYGSTVTTPNRSRGLNIPVQSSFY